MKGMTEQLTPAQQTIICLDLLRWQWTLHAMHEANLPASELLPVMTIQTMPNPLVRHWLDMALIVSNVLHDVRWNPSKYL